MGTRTGGQTKRRLNGRTDARLPLSSGSSVPPLTPAAVPEPGEPICLPR